MEHKLPRKEFASLWDAIQVDSGIKDRLLSQALLNFTVRSKIDRARVPMHGIILLAGQPGTGKTSLAKGLADRVAHTLTKTKLAYLEVEPHSLQSSHLGKSQKAVTDLFAITIAERAAQGPTFVLLDEVETLIVDRSKLSMDANPIDVHRATDAALVQLDHLAEAHPHLLFVATSNFPSAIDGAFQSRCDLIVDIPLPEAVAIRAIMEDTIRAFAQAYPKVNGLLSQPAFASAVTAAHGLDGRQIRKAVASAFTFDRNVALDPELVSAEHLIQAMQLAKKGQPR